MIEHDTTLRVWRDGLTKEPPVYRKFCELSESEQTCILTILAADGVHLSDPAGVVRHRIIGIGDILLEPRTKNDIPWVRFYTGEDSGDQT